MSYKDDAGRTVEQKGQDGAAFVMLADPETGDPFAPFKEGGIVDPSNFTQAFRDAFDSFDPAGSTWDLQLANGDICFLDGNALGAGYLVISKDPTQDNTLTTLTSKLTASMPIEVGIGMHTSQRVIGQEIAAEVISDDPPLPAPPDMQIASVSQAGATLTVQTVNPHNLSPGNRISTYGIPDSRLNYPTAVVATTTDPHTFTVGSASFGALPSVTSGPFTSGMVARRSPLGLAQSGTSMIMENATATQASFYSRSNSGDSVASGTQTTNHSATIGTSASTQPANTPYTYAFLPTTEYRLSVLEDRLQWSDAPVDSTGATISRYVRTQVIPDVTKNYKLRFRVFNDHGITLPVAKIVTASKAGSTTATIITDQPHGLTTSDFVLVYGLGTNAAFANVTTPAAVASVVSPTQFTIVWAGVATATLHGGMVARANGGSIPPSFINNSIASATLATAADGTQALTIVGASTWANTLLTGDLCNVYGLRLAADGTDLGCDGAWKVRNVSGTSVELGPIGNTTPPANFATVAAGGAIIKRTDLRLSFVRMFEFDRLRTEAMARPQGDAAAAQPVDVKTPSLAVTQASGSTWTETPMIPQLVADQASAAITATTTSATITPTYGNEYEVNIAVTAASGTNPTLDVVIQESDDGGTNWYDVWHFPRITAIGSYRSPKLLLKGTRVRYVQTVSGTSASFTRSMNRLQGSAPSVTPIKRIFDRSIVLTTAGSATAVLTALDCDNAQLVVSIGAATTAPQLQLQGSEDGTNWYNLGAALAAVANSTVQLAVNGLNTGFVRAVVSTAGAAVTPNYVSIKVF